MEMVEKLTKLRKIAQKPNYRKIGNLMARYITRDMALPLTWLLLHTPITANQVTAFSIVIGIAGSLFFAVNCAFAYIFAAVLLQFWYLLDHVDGQIARYRKKESITGLFLDYIGHHLVHALIPIGVGLGAYRVTGNIIWVILSDAAAVGIILLNLLNDCRYKAYYGYLFKWKSFAVAGRAAEVEGLPAGRVKRLARYIFSYMHKFCEVHVMMNVVTALALAYPLFKDGPLYFTAFYAFMAPFVSISKLIYAAKKGSCDKDFAETFKRVE